MSGLSFLSKLVERIVAAQIRSHMDSHDLGNTFQSAYKVGHSTEAALLCIKNENHLALSKGMPTALVLLDLSAAFDVFPLYNTSWSSHQKICWSQIPLLCGRYSAVHSLIP